MKFSPNTVLYIPVEERSREFDARLLLSCVAAERGFIVLFGQQSFIFQYCESLPPGILLLKGMNAVQMQVAAKSERHVVVALDEEAMGLSNDKFLAEITDPTATKFCQTVLAQSQHHAKTMVERVGFPAEAIAVTGNPRLDVLRMPLREMFRDDAEAIRHKYGRFILFTATPRR
jgi:surface carbohydrate biosynthesis protein